MKTYADTVKFLFSQLPMFQRIGGAAYKADLSNTLKMCELAGNPELNLKYVHVAGTNGKGSVCHLIASVLQEQGYKVGLYTSPHLKDFRERIRVNGDKVPETWIVEFVNHFKKHWEEIEPSFFEITFLMALEYFNFSEVDIAIMETGMGGRLDSTNVILPEISVITNIGLDHTQFLGDTLQQIAAEKAGIIKEGVPVVLGEMADEVYGVFENKAKEMHTSVTTVRDSEIQNIPSDLVGPYQDQNRKTALLALAQLRSKGWQIDNTAIQRGFAKVKENTNLRGRWDILSEKPLTVADCAHNVDGLTMVLNTIKKMDYHDLHVVLGVVGDKDVDAILDLFPQHATYYFCKADIPRGLDAEKLQQMAQFKHLRGEVFTSVKKAYEAARLYATPNDLIFIGGSVFTVAEVI
jgi:dihydrofolate synthase / folylpolyglutamate synthase